jgi:hypothetical protein
VLQHNRKCQCGARQHLQQQPTCTMALSAHVLNLFCMQDGTALDVL